MKPYTIMFNIFVNFKTYPQGSGENAVGLTKILRQAQDKFSSVKIIPVVQTVDVFRIRQEVEIPVWVQHLDFHEAVIEAGASGTLLNHSDHQIPPGTIKQIISRISNFDIMVCCKTLGQMERLVKLKPDFIGYEISNLIGGKISITETNPKEIVHAVEICGKIPLIVGAGINQPEDLAKAKELGASGVLISSAVVLAQKPKEKILELLSLLRED